MPVAFRSKVRKAGVSGSKDVGKLMKKLEGTASEEELKDGLKLAVDTEEVMDTVIGQEMI